MERKRAKILTISLLLVSCASAQTLDTTPMGHAVQNEDEAVSTSFPAIEPIVHNREIIQAGDRRILTHETVYENGSRTRSRTYLYSPDLLTVARLVQYHETENNYVVMIIHDELGRVISEFWQIEAGSYGGDGLAEKTMLVPAECFENYFRGEGREPVLIRYDHLCNGSIEEVTHRRHVLDTLLLEIEMIDLHNDGEIDFYSIVINNGLGEMVEHYIFDQDGHLVEVHVFHYSVSGAQK